MSSFNKFQAYKAYQASQTQTSSPIDISIMVYERCLLNLKYVKAKYEEFNFSDEDLEKKLINTEQLLMEMKAGLTTEENYIPKDMREQVLEHSNTLRMLYDWLINEVVFMRTSKKSSEISNVIECIQDLLDGDRFARDKSKGLMSENDV